MRFSSVTFGSSGGAALAAERGRGVVDDGTGPTPGARLGVGSPGV